MKKTIQYSKLLPIITCAIFLFCLVMSFKANVTTMIDTTIYATSITISGGIFSSSIIWYMKKAQIENSYKLKNETYKQVIDSKILYTEEILKLKQKYKVDMNEEITDDDIEQMEDVSLNDIENFVDNSINDAEQFMESNV